MLDPQRRKGTYGMVKMPSLHRKGSRAMLGINGGHFTAQCRLDQIGSGLYLWVLVLCIGGANMAESLEMGSVAPIHSALARTFGLSNDQQSLLPFITYGGSAIGLLLSGPICDWRGRKPALQLSLVTMALVMFITAIVPNNTSPTLVLSLRFLAGFTGAVQIPAGCILAVESSPAHSRSWVVFGITLMGAIGYFVEALVVEHFMPAAGEEPTDHWRAYCYVVGVASLCAMPFLYWLQESPLFLVMNGDPDGSVEALDNIARMNGKPPISVEVAEGFEEGGRQVSEQSGEGDSMRRAASFGVRKSVPELLATPWTSYVLFIIMLLSILDGGRSFMVTGSAYLWKDLFMLAEGQSTLPARLNVISSLAPIIGLLISLLLLCIGVKRLALVAATVAGLAFSALSGVSVRMDAQKLFFCFVAVKGTYGSLIICTNLIKAESFATEFRATGFSIVTVLAKAVGLLALTLIQSLKSGETVDSWNAAHLNGCILSLLAATVFFALCIAMVPGQTGEGKKLDDFIRSKVMRRLSPSYGATATWDESTDSDDGGHVVSHKSMPA